jgi:hypothetical protein
MTKFLLALVVVMGIVAIFVPAPRSLAEREKDCGGILVKAARGGYVCIKADSIVKEAK